MLQTKLGADNEQVDYLQKIEQSSEAPTEAPLKSAETPLLTTSPAIINHLNQAGHRSNSRRVPTAPNRRLRVVPTWDHHSESKIRGRCQCSGNYDIRKREISGVWLLLITPGFVAFLRTLFKANPRGTWHEVISSS